MRGVALVAMLTMLVSVAGCGSDQPRDPTATPGDSGRIELTFEGEEAPPTERVQVDPGEEIEIVIKSDRAGELHVHSEPAQVLAYAAGTTSLKLTIDQPGVVDVERHQPPALVLQLEVS